MTEEPTPIKPTDPMGIGEVTGIVKYDVMVECPHCCKKLALNQHPYNDSDGEYGLSEDILGMELFGSSSNPAQWSNFKIGYKCCGCKYKFILTGLEI